MGWQVEHGLGFGGKLGEHRLWLDADFSEFRARRFGHSYGPGQLCTPKEDTVSVRRSPICILYVHCLLMRGLRTDTVSHFFVVISSHTILVTGHGTS